MWKQAWWIFMRKRWPDPLAPTRHPRFDRLPCDGRASKFPADGGAAFPPLLSAPIKGPPIKGQVSYPPIKAATPIKGQVGYPLFLHPSGIGGFWLPRVCWRSAAPLTPRRPSPFHPSTVWPARKQFPRIKGQVNYLTRKF